MLNLLQYSQLRLLVELDLGSSTDRAALEAAAAEALGGEWAARRLFPRRRRPDLARHWTLTGQLPVSPPGLTPALAYDAAGALAERLHTVVEPDLPSSAFSGGGRAQHLPGSAGKDWALRAIGALAAQQRPPQPGGAPRGRGIRIGHIDTGYSDHPELAGMIDPARGFDFVDDDNDARDPLYDIPWWPLDTPGHGTATGSVIASRASAEILGVAPEADLVPIRAVTSVVQVFDGDVARSVDHARRVGCDVITMSLGGRGFAGLRAAIAAAVAEGRIVMAAAGNFVGFVVAPAVYPECLAVAASNAASEPSSGSSRGDAVDISAPGESVWVAAIDVGARPPRFFADRADGTSFSVALLAGVAALWLAHHGPSAIRRQFGTANVQSAFLEMVRQTCQTPAGWDTAQFGAGIVDADALLAADLTAPRLAEAPAPAPDFDPLRRITAAYTERPPTEVADALAARFGVPRSELDAVLRRQSSELVYLLGENPDRAAELLDLDGAGAPAAALRAELPEISRKLAAELA